MQLFVAGDRDSDPIAIIDDLIKSGFYVTEGVDFSGIKNLINELKENFTTEKFAEFRTELSKIKIKEDAPRFLDLGDNFSDRIGNDLINMAIYADIIEKNVNFTSVLSNHVQMLLTIYYLYLNEDGTVDWPGSNFTNNPVDFDKFSKEIKSSYNDLVTSLKYDDRFKACYRSLFTMLGSISADKTGELGKYATGFIKNTLLPRMNLLHIENIPFYTNGADNLIPIFTHAPIDRDIIAGALKNIGITYSQESSRDEKIKQLKLLNEKFKNILLLNKNNFLSYISALVTEDETDFPDIYNFLWNRPLSGKELLTAEDGIFNIHGHDHHRSIKANSQFSYFHYSIDSKRALKSTEYSQLKPGELVNISFDNILSNNKFEIFLKYCVVFNDPLRLDDVFTLQDDDDDDSYIVNPEFCLLVNNNEKDLFYGFSSFLLAVFLGHTEIVNLMLDQEDIVDDLLVRKTAKTSPKLAEYSNKTALEIAEMCGHKEIAEILQGNIEFKESILGKRSREESDNDYSDSESENTPPPLVRIRREEPQHYSPIAATAATAAASLQK